MGELRGTRRSAGRRRVCARSSKARRCPGSGVDAGAFWAGFAALVAEFAPRHRERRWPSATGCRQLIDRWHVEHRLAGHDAVAYRPFWSRSATSCPPATPFEIDTANVDREISELAGPQLVVPISNARYALNAANARWGSLYDALYGTDAIEPPLDTPGYDPTRGGEVIAWVRRFLDDVVPLDRGSHADATSYAIADDALMATFADGSDQRAARSVGAGGLPGHRRPAVGGAARTPRARHRARDRPGASGRRRRPGGDRRRRDGVGGHDDRRPGGLGRRPSTVTTRSARIATGSA